MLLEPESDGSDELVDELSLELSLDNDDEEADATRSPLPADVSLAISASGEMSCTLDLRVAGRKLLSEDDGCSRARRGRARAVRIDRIR